MDDGALLDCPAASNHEPALLTTAYPAARAFVPDSALPGLYRYHRWLPINRALPGAGKTVIYQSSRLNSLLGLPQLWIAFNGYWPAKGAMFQTATFKELEAYTVLSRLPERHDRVLVVASAGNTAAAFAHVCSQTRTPCLIIMPESGMGRMRFSQPLAPCVKVIELTGLSDYYDAIQLARRITDHAGFFFEGGVQNVARRDGLGTVLLSAVETFHQLPAYYFQAIGSGAGAIAVHDVARRLLADGRFGENFPRLMLSQNVPFAPIYHSWRRQRREFIEIDRQEGKRQLQQIAAVVLSNQRPPYSTRGGVFDVLCESKGDMLVATNQQVEAAMSLFLQNEGIDIDPASGVALATLIQAAQQEQIDRKALILLNITGGGAQCRQEHNHLIPLEPTLSLPGVEHCEEQTIETILKLF